MNINKLIIMIPCHDSEQSIRHLHDLFHSLMIQDDQNFEVILSFHSANDESFQDLTSFLSTFELDITAYKFSDKIGNWTANFNSLLSKLPRNRVVKIMFQDDVLIRQDTLSLVRETMGNSKTWMALGCYHFNDSPIESMNQTSQIQNTAIHNFFNPHSPRWDDRMVSELINFIGAPSVIAFFNEDKLHIDEKIIFGGDVVFYYLLFLRFGAPKLVPDLHLGIRKHNKSVTESVSTGYKGRMPDGRKIRNRKDVHVREVILVKRLFNLPLQKYETRPFLLISFLKNSVCNLPPWIFRKNGP